MATSGPAAEADTNDLDLFRDGDGAGRSDPGVLAAAA